MNVLFLTRHDNYVMFGLHFFNYILSHIKNLHVNSNFFSNFNHIFSKKKFTISNYISPEVGLKQYFKIKKKCIIINFKKKVISYLFCPCLIKIKIRYLVDFNKI